MKNMKNLCFLLSLILMAGCAEDNLSSVETGQLPLQINLSMQGFASANPDTRASETGYATSFDNGDEIGIIAVRTSDSRILDDNLKYIYDGTKWSPAGDSIHAYSVPVNYIAYYPYSSGMDGKKTISDISDAFTPRSDQSAYPDYTASDLMAGYGTRTGATLNISLTHQLALVEVHFPSLATGINVPGYYRKDDIFRYLVKPASPVSFAGSYTFNGMPMKVSQSVTLLASGKYSHVNVSNPCMIEGGYEGALHVIYTDDSFEDTTVPAYGYIQLTGGAGKTIKSITLTDVSSAPVLIGRKTSDPFVLKFNGSGGIVFRDADASGFVPIGSYAEFQKIYEGNYKQEADLDLMNIEWTPINSFGGKFDGGGHTIDNLKVTSGTSIGLFCFVRNNSTLSNIHISSGVVSSSFQAGGLVGQVSSSGISVINCSNNARITSSSAGNIGGIVGVCANGTGNTNTIIGCKNTGDIVSAGNYAGGITGATNSTCKIIACYNTGDVSGGGYIGGICGYNQGVITACYNRGQVTGSSSVGSVAGVKGTITASYWEDVSGGATESDAGASQFGDAGSSFTPWPDASINTGDPSNAWSGTYWKPFVAGEYPKLVWE
jgi:hypothetical protein